MNKACEELQERLSAYLDGELSKDERQNLEGHLTTCPDCPRIVEDYSKIGVLVREEVDAKVATMDLRGLPEKVQRRISRAARQSDVQSIRLKPRAQRFKVAWAVGLAVAITLIWLGPQFWRIPDKTGRSLIDEVVQEQLGQAIRDTAGIRLAILEVSARYQEELGRLIREGLQVNVQEQLGVLIRDHAYSQWDLNQQRGRLQEKIGLLIQTHARQQFG